MMDPPKEMHIFAALSSNVGTKMAAENLHTYYDIRVTSLSKPDAIC